MNNSMTFDEYLAQEMENPEFRAEREVLEPEFQIASAIIEGGALPDFTPEQIAEVAGANPAKARVMRMDNYSYASVRKIRTEPSPPCKGRLFSSQLTR